MKRLYTRGFLYWLIRDKKWCTKCGQVVEFSSERCAGGGGVNFVACLNCKTRFTENYMEPEESCFALDIKIPEGAIEEYEKEMEDGPLKALGREEDLIS